MNRMFFTLLGEYESSELSQTEPQVSQTAVTHQERTRRLDEEQTGSE